MVLWRRLAANNNFQCAHACRPQSSPCQGPFLRRFLCNFDSLSIIRAQSCLLSVTLLLLSWQFLSFHALSPLDQTPRPRNTKASSAGDLERHRRRPGPGAPRSLLAFYCDLRSVFLNAPSHELPRSVTQLLQRPVRLSIVLRLVFIASTEEYRTLQRASVQVTDDLGGRKKKTNSRALSTGLEKRFCGAIHALAIIHVRNELSHNHFQF